MINKQELAEIYGTINDFNRLVLNDISNVSKISPVAALILILCAIDYLKSFRYGLIAIDTNTHKLLKVKYPSDKRLDIVSTFKPAKYYMEYLAQYLRPIDKRYNVKEIYENLRCGLVHNYSDRIFKYHFIDNRSHDNTAFHLIPCPDGKTMYFNIDVFFNDFIKMCRLFFKDALEKDEIMRNIFDFRSFVGFLHA